MRLKAAFTLHERHSRKGSIWHASWYDRDGIRRTKSTGEPVNAALKDRGRTLAERVAVWLVSAQRPLHRVPTFREYAGHFYAPGSEYLKRQKDKGKSLNSQWAHGLQSLMKKYVLPRWGETRLDAFNSVQVENWLAGVPLSSQSRRHLLYGCMRVPLREAARERIIPTNPLQEVEPPVKQSREHDVFTIEELKLLFPASQAELLIVWKSAKYAALFVTLASTGIREGEVRALQWKHVRPEGWLVVERAVKIDGSIGALKARERSGEPRVVALPSRARSALDWWHGFSAHTAAEDLVFFGDNPGHPMNRRTFVDVLQRAFEGDHRKDETKPARISSQGRFLTTHSFRHTYNTTLRRVVPADALLALMGHRDGRMSQLYDHPVIEDRIRALEGIRPQIEGALRW